jgi:hypothetical protein
VSFSITPSNDGRFIDVFVPIAFKRFRGRKVIVAPDGKPVLPDQSRAADKTLTKALARACRWQKLLDDGIYASLMEIAEKERINGSYLSRTIRLSLLAPDIVEAILNGTQPSTLRLTDLEAPFSIDWKEQRTAFGFTEMQSP